MAWIIILGTLAAWGLLCILWAALGWLLPGSSGGVMLCLCRLGKVPDGVILRYCWLRGLGLMNCPLLILDSSLSRREQEIYLKKYPGIEFCSLEEVPARLEVERNRIERNGNGDPPGCHQRRGISEL